MYLQRWKTKRAWELTPWTFREFDLHSAQREECFWTGTVFLKNGITLRNSLYEVTLHYQEKQKTVLALLDTGNQLYEPYGHQPVHILEKNAWPELPEPVFKVIYIPFCSVGKEHGILAAVRMERMEVRQRERKSVCWSTRGWRSVKHRYLYGINTRCFCMENYNTGPGGWKSDR